MRILRLLLLLTAALPLAGALAQEAPTYPDVPPEHWARNAVEKTTKLGLLTGFPDGYFHGNENLTRYQAAMVLYRLIQYIQAQPGQIDAADLEALRLLAEANAREIAALAARLEDTPGTGRVLERLAELEHRFEDLARLTQETLASQSALRPLLDQLPAIESALAGYADLRRDLEELRALLYGEQARLSELAQRVDEASRVLAELQRLYDEHERRIAALEERADASDEAIAALAARVAQLEALHGIAPPEEPPAAEAKPAGGEGEAAPALAKAPAKPAGESRGGRLAPIAGAGYASGPGYPFEFDHLGGLEGDGNVAAPDWLGEEAFSLWFGLASLRETADYRRDWSLGVQVFPAGDPYYALPFGHYRYADDARRFEAVAGHRLRFQLTPYLFDDGAAAPLYTVRAAYQAGANGLAAGAFLEDDLSPGGWLEYRRREASGSSLRAGVALAAGAPVLYGELSYAYRNARLLALCHYPLAGEEGTVCYGQARIDDDEGNYLYADYRALGSEEAVAYASPPDGDEPYRYGQVGYGLGGKLTVGRFTVSGSFNSYNLEGIEITHAAAGVEYLLTPVLAVGGRYQRATAFGLPAVTVPRETPSGIYTGASAAYLVLGQRAEGRAWRLEGGYAYDPALEVPGYPYLRTQADLIGGYGQIHLAGRWQGGAEWDGKFALAYVSAPLGSLGAVFEARAGWSDGAELGREVLLGAGIRTLPGGEGPSFALRAGYYLGSPLGPALAGAVTADRAFDPEQPGLYPGGFPEGTPTWYAGAQLGLAGFELSAGYYRDPLDDVVTLRLAYNPLHAPLPR